METNTRIRLRSSSLIESFSLVSVEAVKILYLS